jgi:predicted ABC-type ATPase
VVIVANESDQLAKEAHDRILREEILTRRNFVDATPQERPKAIILAGQPGAGKGTLGGRAEMELGNNVVTVDPDALRDYHPRVDGFRRETPYTWSGRTHADASQWADELREATVSSKKNLIFDTTLSNGQWTSDLIKDLQAKGYEVEVRAIASPKLESELGVDGRFTRDVDKKGTGRHVPEGAREAIYDKLPNSLNTVHAQTDVPIRIFNREGVELYDSRTDTRLPGVALEEAREARLKDPSITRDLRDGWREQQAWHRDLPDNLANNPKVDPATRENLLAERSANHVVESVDRTAREAIEVDRVTRVRPARIHAGTALGVAGLALEVYDGVDSVQTADRLASEGNRSGAESELIHFGARSVGGWAGAGIGMAGGALLGVETGPGLLVTGAIGGVAGVFAGDKFAEWTDNRRIYNQELGGNTWTHDPENPSLGWRRRAPIDSTDDNIDNARRGDLRASPATENQLNYQATSVSVELVLGGPPAQRSPFSLPAEAGDPPSSRPTNWERDPETGKWQREVYGPFVERGGTPHYTDPANDERAARLDRQAAAIVVENAANSPASIAARYEDTYLRNGWQAYGEMPEAVRNNRTNIDTLIGSDGEFYQRQANGRWVNDDMIDRVSGNHIASGRLHDELEATRAVLEARLPPPREIPPAPQMDADARLRDTLSGAYRNAGVEASDQQIAVAANAVRATWEANGLDPATTALHVKPQGDGRYGLDSPIASLRLDADGKTYVIAAETTPTDIERSRTSMTSSPHAIERPSEQDREAREQAQREANRQGLAEDGMFQATPAPARMAAPNRREDEPREERSQERNAGPQAEQISVASTIPAAPRLPDPRDPDHADHRFYKRLEHGVASIDAEQGRSFNATSERLTMCAFHDAKAAGITSPDHVAINQTGKRQQDGTQVAGGTLLFVVQGQDPSDPAARRSVTDVAQAIDRPVEQSLQKVDALAQQQAQVLAQQQSQSVQDEPSRMHRMV